MTPPGFLARRLVPRRPLLAGAAILVVFALAGCSGHRDVLDPASPQNRSVAGLWWLYFSVTGAVFAAVLAWVAVVVARARRHSLAERASPPLVLESDDPRERRNRVLVTLATIATAAILLTLLFVDFGTGRALRPTTRADLLQVKITGRQWWWQIEYEDPVAGNIVITANELHLPLGRPVELQLQSRDVIHSFWIPNLHGKKDLVPGKPTTLTLVPDRLGTFQGQCAEFCGLQHAHMGLLAVVESPEEFEHWRERQRQPAPEPQTDAQKRGLQVFLTTSCVLCHTIQGTPAGGRVGPPLTHIASQQMLASNSFPNRRGYLAGWIVDPQSMKPGVRMPQNLLSGDDLNALLDYLETLQ